MKTIKKAIIIVLLYMPVQIFSQVKSAQLTAAGLTCSMCSKAIYTALLKLAFIEKIEVDLNTSSYSIQFKSNSTVELDELKKTIEGAGFSIASLKVKAIFENVEVFNDAHINFEGINLHFLNTNKQQLMGEVVFTVVDKGFVSDKVNRKYSVYTTMPCFKTGKTEACCTIDKSSKSSRIYHVTL